MDANLEKYRELSVIIKTYTKRDLFGPTGVFGDPEKNPKPFELFRKWLLKITRIDKNQIEQDTVTEQKFVNFLRANQEKDENKDLIRKIEELHTDNIIEDRSENKNILLKFAKALNSLGIINDPEESYLNNYRVAIRTARQLAPLYDEKVAKIEVSKKEAKNSTITNGDKKSDVKGKQENGPINSGSTDSIPTGNTSTGAVSSESGAANGASSTGSGEEELQMRVETSDSEKIIGKDKNKDKEKIESEEKKTEIQKVQPVNPTNTFEINAEKNEIEIPKNEKKEPTKIPTESEFKEDSKLKKGQNISEDFVVTSEISSSINFNKPTTGKKIVRGFHGSNGQTMRSAQVNKGPLRVEDTKNPQSAPQNQATTNQNNQESSRFSAYQNKSIRRQQIERSQQEQPKKKGLASKLIKRGAVAAILGGGTLFGIMNPTADAATFKSIISFIQLFIK